MNATHLRIISCPREGGEMTGYNPDQQPKCRLTESAFRDDRLKPFFSNVLRLHREEQLGFRRESNVFLGGRGRARGGRRAFASPHPSQETGKDGHPTKIAEAAARRAAVPDLQDLRVSRMAARACHELMRARPDLTFTGFWLLRSGPGSSVFLGTADWYSTVFPRRQSRPRGPSAPPSARRPC